MSFGCELDHVAGVRQPNLSRIRSFVYGRSYSSFKPNRQMLQCMRTILPKVEEKRLFVVARWRSTNLQSLDGGLRDKALDER